MRCPRCGQDHEPVWTTAEAEVERLRKNGNTLQGQLIEAEAALERVNDELAEARALAANLTRLDTERAVELMRERKRANNAEAALEQERAARRGEKKRGDEYHAKAHRLEARIAELERMVDARDVGWAGTRIAELRDRIADLEAALRVYRDGITWMSGSGDFAPEGKAYRGWLQLRRNIEQADSALAGRDTPSMGTDGQAGADESAPPSLAELRAAGALHDNLWQDALWRIERTERDNARLEAALRELRGLLSVMSWDNQARAVEIVDRALADQPGREG